MLGILYDAFVDLLTLSGYFIMQVVSSALIGATAGSMAAGSVVETLGLRWTFMLLSLPIIIGSAASSVASTAGTFGYIRVISSQWRIVSRSNNSILIAFSLA